MIITTYTTKSPYNQLEKVLENEVNYNNAKIKDNTSIINPVLYIHADTFINANYVFIPEFNRYYFINDINLYPNNIYELSCSCDVLESWKEDIKKATGNIIQQEKFNPYYDSNYKSEVRQESERYESDKEVKLEESIILVTIGG